MRFNPSTIGQSRSRPSSKKKKSKSTHFKKGPIFTATVRDFTSDGRGIISDPDGLTIFVAGVWKDEVGTFRLIGKQKSIGLGELIDLTEASPERCAPICKHHGFSSNSCGGCSWQFMEYESQLKAKQQRIENAISRFSDCKINPIQASSSTSAYRNRAQFKSDGETIGYVSAASNTLAPITECPILTKQNQKTLSNLIAMLPNAEWKPKRHVQWTTINIDESVSADNVSINSRLPFQQSNDEQNQFMRDWLSDKLNTANKESRVLELFCGSGNFTSVISECGFSHITAVDGAGHAIEELKTNMPSVTAIEHNLFNPEVFSEIYKKHGAFDILVLDPPRDGLKNHENLLSKKHRFTDIFYISCDLATFCRDAHYFSDNGYSLEHLQPVDQSPHTPHVELLGHFKRG